MLLKLFLFSSSIALLPFSSFAAENASSSKTDKIIYKYTDEQGATVISSTLPPEAANRGYAILNSLGHVQEKIEPKLSDAEMAKEAERKKLEEQYVIEQAKETEKDEALLRMFTSIEDIQRSRNEQISSISVLENITKENIKRMEEQLANFNKSATLYQNQKQPLPPTLKKSIETTLKQISDNKFFFKQKQEDKKQVQEQYDRIITRFKDITEKPALNGNPENTTLTPQEYEQK